MDVLLGTKRRNLYILFTLDGFLVLHIRYGITSLALTVGDWNVFCTMSNDSLGTECMRFISGALLEYWLLHIGAVRGGCPQN